MTKYLTRKVEIEEFGTFAATVKEGTYWNGFECPYFSKEEADKLLEAINSAGTMGELKFNEDTDSYSYFEDSELVDTYEVTIIEGEKKYPIGAYAWVWTESVTVA